MENEFLDIDKITFVDSESIVTTTTTSPTTTTTTTEPIPVINVCEDCVPPLDSQYSILFSDLDGGLSEYNNSYIIENDSYCTWHKEISNNVYIFVNLFPRQVEDEIKSIIEISIYDSNTKGFVQWQKNIEDICDIIQTATSEHIVNCQNTATCSAKVSISKV